MSDAAGQPNTQLWDTFTGEAREHLQIISQSLLELEKKQFPEPRLRLIDTAFRSAHSLKGAAAVVRLVTVVNICQSMETIFGKLKRGDMREDSELFDVLQGVVDTIHDLIGTPTDSGLPPSAVQVVRSLQQYAGSDSHQPAATNTARLRRPRTVRLFRNRGELVNDADKTADEKSDDSLGRTKTENGRRRKPTAPPQRDALPVAPPPDRREISASLTSHSMHRAQVGNTIRLDVEKLDELLRRVEELSAGLRLDRQIAEDSIQMLERAAASFSELTALEPKLRRLQTGQAQSEDLRDVLRLNRQILAQADQYQTALKQQSERQAAERQRIHGMVDAMRIDVRRILMMPFATLFSSFPRMVRDLARSLDKLAELDVEGAGIEVSRQILDELRDPLVHILRNAIDHGIEPPDVREELGKPRLGAISVTISRAANDLVEIVISDDGAGIDIPALKTRAIAAGVIDTIDAAGMDDQAALDLIFRADVSTCETVSVISGRGLGMAIVRERLDHLGGSISAFSEPGEGTTYRIILPSSLATTRAMRITVGGQPFLIPSLYVERILRVPADDIHELESGHWIDLEDYRLTVAELAALLEIPGSPRGTPRQNLLICRAGPHRVALRVDEIKHEEDILVKPLGPVLENLPYFAGAAVLRSGELILILNAIDLIHGATVRITSQTFDKTDVPSRRARLLIVDDMRTMRQYLASILAEAGYDISVASDGLAAWNLLASEPVDLVICDVQMPRMDGHELARRIRDQFGASPAIVMLSSQEKADHIQAGLDAGADAYLRKGELNDELLLETVATHLPVDRTP